LAPVTSAVAPSIFICCLRGECEIAAQKMRGSGTEGPGAAEIMKAAGLTHGGFYKHFDSRDDLVAEAVEAAVAQSREGVAAARADGRSPRSRRWSARC
jgi:TetR/AcrR family transcriptional regulator, transcriptional repressor for nem operon